MTKASVLVVSFFILLMSSHGHAQEILSALTDEQCAVSVSNIQKSIKKHRLKLRKSTARSLSNIEKNIIRTALAELNSKVSIDACTSSEGEVLKGYQCMIGNSDIQACRMDKSKVNK